MDGRHLSNKVHCAPHPREDKGDAVLTIHSSDKLFQQEDEVEHSSALNMNRCRCSEGFTSVY